MSQADLFEQGIRGVPGAVWWEGNKQCRNEGGYLQQRQGGTGDWSYVVFARDEHSFTLYGLAVSGDLVLDRLRIDHQERITINGVKYQT